MRVTTRVVHSGLGRVQTAQRGVVRYSARTRVCLHESGPRPGHGRTQPHHTAVAMAALTRRASAGDDCVDDVCKVVNTAYIDARGTPGRDSSGSSVL